jgi:hypothetical protein
MGYMNLDTITWCFFNDIQDIYNFAHVREGGPWGCFQIKVKLFEEARVEILTKISLIFGEK